MRLFLDCDGVLADFDRHFEDVFGQPLLPGTTRMCTATKRFTIRGIEDCWVRGHIASEFIEVDTQKTRRWTLFLAAQP